MIILALDPSLCCTGWVLAPSHDSPVKDLRHGAIETEPSSKKLRLYQAEDDAKRARVIADRIIEISAGTDELVVVSEQPAGSRHARSAGALKLVQGVIVGVFSWSNAPIHWLTANDGKVALCARKNASKDNMVVAARQKGLVFAGTRPQQEAIADAFGMLVASHLWKPK